MNAELSFIHTLMPVVARMAEAPHKELAAVAAEYHADLAKRAARLKRAVAEQQQQGEPSTEAAQAGVPQ